MTEINSLVIVGGGTAGWISAALLAHERPELKITLVESEAIGTIGVGEATIPPILDLLATLEINLTDFIRSTNATFKLGIEFSNWLSKGHSYIHPFGIIGQSNTSLPFYDHWLFAAKAGKSKPLMSYSPAATMSYQNKFYVPSNAPNTPIAGAGYALHLDAGLAANYLRRYAESRGVTRIEGKVTHIDNDAEQIAAITLDDGQRVQGDFFIDCSGFRALLIKGALGADYEDWSHLLTVNKAVTVQTIGEQNPNAFTQSIAQDFGWSWHIPLQNRTGNGYVFNSDLCGDDEALDTLLKTVKNDVCNEPRFLNFKTGFRKESWKGNCVAIGLASGFLEPLESTAIHMITRGLKLLLRLFPTKRMQPVLSARFNKQLNEDFTEIRDFLLLHYVLSKRTDTEFWAHYQSLEYPDELGEKIALFKERGLLSIAEDRLFVDASWYAVFEGMQCRPKETSPLIDDSMQSNMQALIDQIPGAIDTAVTQLPAHAEFIQRHCLSKDAVYKQSQC